MRVNNDYFSRPEALLNASCSERHYGELGELHLVTLRKRGCPDLSGRGINVETTPPQ